MSNRREKSTGRTAARLAGFALVASAVVWTGSASVSAGDSAGAVAGGRRGAAASLSAGADHTCALLDDSTISCWGSDLNGQIGNGSGSTDNEQSPDNTALPAGTTGKAIAIGGLNSCVILNDNSLSCWGDDNSGQIGDGPQNNNLDGPDLVVPTPDTVVQISVNTDFACGLFANGRIRCWGSDDDGQLGSGGPDVPDDGGDVDTVGNAPELGFPGNATASAVTTGRSHGCAILANATISCWGNNEDGQLGSGSNANQVTSPSSALSLPSGQTAAGVSAGGSHTCALLDNGQVTCWGSDSDGQLGNGAGSADINTPPAAISLPGPAVAVAAGRAHTCAVLQSDDLYCWGDDSQGQIGSAGANSDAASPVQISLSEGVQAVALGDDHTCALLSSGGVSCWGSDASGQLGNGGAGSTSTPPANPIPGLTVAPNAGTPSAPSSLSATGGRESASLSWTAPLDSGGESITGYRIQESVDGGTTWVTIVPDTSSTATSRTVTSATTALSAIYRVAAINSVGVSPYSQPSNAVTVDPLNDLRTFDPIRLLDTRGAGETIDGNFAGDVGTIAADTVVRVQIAGRGGATGVPANAPAAVLNVTAVRASSNGFATIYPCGERPNASTLNFPAERNVANAVVADLDDEGFVCLYTSASSQFIIDASGYVPVGSKITTVNPARLFDTRGAGMTIDGLRQQEGAIVGGQFVEVQIAGRAGSGVPADADTALLNITAVNPTARGFATVYPCGTRPNASSLNFDAGVNKANAVVAKLSSSGSVCVFAERTTNVLLDVTGHSEGATLDPVDPVRLLDTRPAGQTEDGVSQGGGPVPGGTFVKVRIAGRGGVANDASVAALSVVAVNPQGNGFATVYPCTATPPNASNLNYVAGQNVPNLAITSLDAQGDVCIFTSATANILVDVSAAQ